MCNVIHCNKECIQIQPLAGQTRMVQQESVPGPTLISNVQLQGIRYKCGQGVTQCSRFGLQRVVDHGSRPRTIKRLWAQQHTSTPQTAAMCEPDFVKLRCQAVCNLPMSSSFCAVAKCSENSEWTLQGHALTKVSELPELPPELAVSNINAENPANKRLVHNGAHRTFGRGIQRSTKDYSWLLKSCLKFGNHRK